MKNIDTIIWDWNGTLLDDFQTCISIVNNLLKNRGVEPLTEERYKDIFTFPVKDYYAKAGFDFSKEDFQVPADEFINAYNKDVKMASLHKEAEDVLEYFKLKGYRQLIVSAMKQDSLSVSVKDNNILSYFEIVSGLKDHYANSKIENAKSIIEENNISVENCLLIGDTIHDHEVAEILNCDCILVSEGHQSAERLITTGRVVLNSLNELKTII